MTQAPRQQVDRAPGAPASHGRILWMDAVRGAAMITLLVFHATSIPALYAGIESPAWLVAVNNFLAPYRMPLLMLLSGMMLGRSLAKPLGAFYAGKIRGLLYPYLVWAVILLGVTGQIALLTSPQAWIPVTYIWFLLFVFLYYCAAPMLAKLPAPLIVVGAHVAALVLQDSGFISKFVLFAGYFYLGHYIAGRGPGAWFARRPVAAALLVGSVALNLFGGGTQITTFAVTLLGITGLVGFAQAPRVEAFVDRATWLAPVRAIGKHSIVFYLSHFPAMVLLAYALDRFANGAGAIVAWALCLAVAFTVGGALVKNRESRIVRALFAAPRLAVRTRS